VKRALIVCPGSLVKNWEREFKKWLGPERISVFAVNSDKRVQEFVPTRMNPVVYPSELVLWAKLSFANRRC
jgi:DNA repair and recombination protein RAD54B